MCGSEWEGRGCMGSVGGCGREWECVWEGVRERAWDVRDGECVGVCTGGVGTVGRGEGV